VLSGTLNLLRDPLSQKRQFSLKEVIIDFTPSPVVPVSCMETQKPEVPDSHKQGDSLKIEVAQRPSFLIAFQI
jgi:hypothetical protein